MEFYTSKHNVAIGGKALKIIVGVCLRLKRLLIIFLKWFLTK